MASGGHSGMQVVFQMLKKIVKCLGFFCLFVRLVGCLVVFLISLNLFQSTQDAWGACYSKTDYMTQLL